MFLVVLMGESGCGKSTVARLLSNSCGWSVVKSYTDRPRRGPDDNDHIFVDAAYYDLIRDEGKVAETEFDGHRYCATAEQIENAQIYIIDPAGYRELKRRYSGHKRIIPVYIETYNQTRFRRMLKRGDSVASARQRIHNDVDAFIDVDSIPGLIKISGDADLPDVVSDVYHQIKKELNSAGIADRGVG